MTSTAQRLCPAAVAADVHELVAGLDSAPLAEAMASYAAIDCVVEAARSRRLSFAMAAAEEAGQDPLKAARSAASLGGKVSRRSADAAAKRARAIRANEELAARLESGELSTGQIDNIARAMDTDETAATDTVLIDKIAERSVDQGRRAANDWATEKSSAKDLEAKHSKQRRNRKVATYWSRDNDAMALTLYGDGPSIETLWQAINTQERIEYRNDGGRDIRPQDHPRTRDQRRFDAAMAILTGTAKPAGGRPAAVISVPWSKISGNNPDSCMEQIGYGPIPDSIALKALMESDLFMNITGLHGQTMWFGRTRRLADRNQFITLVLRDKGCVLCGNAWQTTESHHLMPAEAPGKGNTNPDNLALVCSRCHHQLHDNHLTLHQDQSSGEWLTRPATADEIAPKRPTTKHVGKRADTKRKPPNSQTRPRSALATIP